jgi:hypothetical protein
MRATGHDRFTPESDRKSGHARMVMSALPLKTDMCDATNDVGYGPIADISYRWAELLLRCARCPRR